MEHPPGYVGTPEFGGPTVLKDLVFKVVSTCMYKPRSLRRAGRGYLSCRAGVVSHGTGSVNLTVPSAKVVGAPNHGTITPDPKQH